MNGGGGNNATRTAPSDECRQPSRCALQAQSGWLLEKRSRQHLATCRTIKCDTRNIIPLMLNTFTFNLLIFLLSFTLFVSFISSVSFTFVLSDMSPGSKKRSGLIIRKGNKRIANPDKQEHTPRPSRHVSAAK